jgi:hypothetical protein
LVHALTKDDQDTAEAVAGAIDQLATHGPSLGPGKKGHIMARNWKDVRAEAIGAGLIDPERVAKLGREKVAEVRAPTRRDP